MTEIVNQSLQRIAKATGIVFTGTMCGTLLGAIGNIILVRYVTQSEYGIYSLSLVIIGILCTISTLGLGEGSARYIAYFRAKNEENNVRGVISSSINCSYLRFVRIYCTSFRFISIRFITYLSKF